MALYVNQKNNRTELQERLAAELREKARKQAEIDGKERPDGVTDSNYLKDTKQTTSLAWVWAIVAVASIVLILYVVIQSS